MVDSDYQKRLNQYIAHLGAEIDNLQIEKGKFMIGCSESRHQPTPADFRMVDSYEQKIRVLEATRDKFYSLFPEVDPRKCQESPLAQADSLKLPASRPNYPDQTEASKAAAKRRAPITNLS